MNWQCHEHCEDYWFAIIDSKDINSKCLEEVVPCMSKSGIMLNDEVTLHYMDNSSSTWQDTYLENRHEYTQVHVKYPYITILHDL